ncbi:MAG: DUF4349 domain-containing protein [Anaerolineae bacterium]|nr:DUF4349 domain-containing protein [Anaerolineae bacterium]
MNKRAIALTSLVVLLVAVLAACGASAAPDYSPAPEPVLIAEQAMAGGYDEANASGSAAEPQTGQMDRMIIWTADIVLTVQDAGQAISDVLALASEMGGYAVNTESWIRDDLLYARLTIRVPAAQFEPTMAHLRDQALKVEHESANSQDVTEEYVDLESRLRALQAKEAQLTKLMDRAEDTEAVLAVYEQLSATQLEIEQVKGRMSYLENLSAMATITVNLNPEQPEAPVIEEGWRPGSTLRSAARALVNALKGLGNLIIWGIVFLLPILLLIALPIVAAFLLFRFWHRRSRSKTPPA